MFIKYSHQYNSEADASYSPQTRQINVFINGDFPSLIHEICHGFEYALDEEQSKILAQYFGIDFDEYGNYGRHVYHDRTHRLHKRIRLVRQ